MAYRKKAGGLILDAIISFDVPQSGLVGPENKTHGVIQAPWSKAAASHQPTLPQNRNFYKSGHLRQRGGGVFICVRKHLDNGTPKHLGRPKAPVGIVLGETILGSRVRARALLFYGCRQWKGCKGSGSEGPSR